MLTRTPDTKPEAADSDTVYLLDVDNTLFDNDRFGEDLHAELTRAFGADGCAAYFAAYEAIRDDVGYADYLGAAQRLRQAREADPALLDLGAWLLDYPFAQNLYPQALQAIVHLRTLGPTALLSDGDIVFQPHKIAHSGLARAVHGNVMVYVHKQHMLDAVQRRFGAAHYVMVDDKPHLLSAMKRVMGSRLTTVFVRQGHYAAAGGQPGDLPADRQIERIGELCAMAAHDFALTAEAPSAD